MYDPIDYDEDEACFILWLYEQEEIIEEIEGEDGMGLEPRPR